MKTQLLEDIDDSGALPVRPRPAVWQRPRFDDGPAGPPAGAAQRTPGTASARPGRNEPVRAPAAVRTSSSAPRPAEPAPAPAAEHASSSAPKPAEAAPATSSAQASAYTSGPEPGRAAPDPAQPDWLADILRQDAQDAAAARRAPACMARLLAWSAAACALAVMAAGGLWLFEERRADGALMVVAESSPAPAPTAARAPPPVAPAPVFVPAAPASSTEALVPVQATMSVPAVQAQPAVAPAQTPAPEPAPASPETPAVKAETPAPKPAARREPASARVAASSKAKPERGIGAQRRREETLVQCQAHGYDERQCVQRACELTRYGLACRG